jgi:hypothetical protein
MKKVLLCITLAFSCCATAQVGIGTSDPKATLDISVNAEGSLTTPTGLLIPRVSRAIAQNITVDPSLVTTPKESTLIYVNDVSSGTAQGIAEEIDTKGFYYYSEASSKWRKIYNNPDGSTDINNYEFESGLTPISNGNMTKIILGGDLLDDTTITNAGKKLAISGGINNAFSVDDETFSVDGATNNVGIGTTTPRSKLHVLGSVQFTNSLKVGDTASEGILGQYLVSGGPGESPKWVNGPSDGVNPSPIAVSARNGLNTVSDDGTEFVELGGTIGRETNLDILGSEASFNITGGGRNAFSVGGDNLSVDNAKDFVGVGTATPLNKLHIYNDTAGAIRIVDGTQGVNKVLTSDASGVGTWKDPQINSTQGANGLSSSTVNNITTVKLGGFLTEENGTKITSTDKSKLNIAGDVTNAFSVGGNNFSVDNKNNRVGIGTTEPTNKLHINNGTAPGAIKIQDGTQSNGRVLTSNADGVGTWKDIPQNTTALNGLTPSTTNGVTTIKLGGNLTENTTIDTYPSGGVRYNLKLVGLAEAPATDTGILMVDANNNVRKTNHLSSDLRIPEPAVFQLDSDKTDFLNNIEIGSDVNVKMSNIVNGIRDLTFNTTNDATSITFPPGVYQTSFVYEANYDNMPDNIECTISSYFVDFPYTGTEDGNPSRIHSTATHNRGSASNHGGTIIFTSVLRTNYTWNIKLGLGQSGNCTKDVNNNEVGIEGLKLERVSTQLTIMRIGDVPN